MASESVQETHRQSSHETAVVDALLEARAQLSGVPDAEIVVMVHELVARRRVLDAALVEVAGELLRREGETPRSETVARRAGFRNLPAMFEQVLGVMPVEANTLVKVAEATRGRMSFSGEPIPAAYAEVSRAVASGVMSVAQASAITKGLEQTRNRVDVEDVARAEAELVASACGQNPEDEQPAVPKVLEVQAATWVSYLDPDGDEPRAEKIAEERGFWWVRRADGAIAGKFVATPEQGEQLISVLDALLAPRRTVEFPPATGCGEPVAAVHRRARLGPEVLRRIARRAPRRRGSTHAGHRDYRDRARGTLSPARGRAAPRTHRRAHPAFVRGEGHVRRIHPRRTPGHKRRDPGPRQAATPLHDRTTAGDLRPRPTLPSPRVRSPSTLVRNTPRGALERRRTHRREGRHLAVLVPPPRSPPEQAHPHPRPRRPLESRRDRRPPRTAPKPTTTHLREHRRPTPRTQPQRMRLGWAGLDSLSY